MVQYPMQRVAVTAGFAMYNPFASNPSMHYAIDISRTQPESFNVYAANEGKVVLSLYDSSGGNMIAIQGYYNEKKDIITRYAHLSIRSVFKGDTVTRGQVIGIQGNTGTATTGQHLHFETWIVPKNYSYSFADRSKYAVDPVSICQLLDSQIFMSDAETFNYEALPYPLPDIAATDVVEGKVTVVGDLEMYFAPGSRYMPCVSGYNRGKKYISDYFYDTVFTCTKTCTIEGQRWALVNTARGDVWVQIINGKSVLTAANINPVTQDSAECEEQLAQVKQELEIYKNAVLDLNGIISRLDTQYE